MELPPGVRTHRQTRSVNRNSWIHEKRQRELMLAIQSDHRVTRSINLIPCTVDTALKCFSYSLCTVGADRFTRCCFPFTWRRTREYEKHFNAVDRNDRDNSDYTCSIRTARWYLSIFFWLLDRAVLSLFIII